MSEGPQAVTLFREEALAARFQRAGSAIIIATPASTRLVALAALAIAATLIGLAIWGQWTRTVTVSGALIPERGMIRVFSPQGGIVIARRFRFGDKVTRGQPLYSVSSDRAGADGAALAERISAAIKVRIATLKTTIVSTAGLQAMEFDRVTRQHAEIIAEMGVLAIQNQLQADMVQSAQRVLGRKAILRESGVIPIDQLEQSQRLLAGDEASLLSLQNAMQKLRQIFADTQSQLLQLPLTAANQNNDLQRQLAFAEADLAENEMRREVVIAAPEDGTISADMVEVGQTVTTGAAMAIIAPRDADLEAHLLVPSSGIGFIKPGALVAMRYQAYPYQKFGLYEGQVRAISDVALGAAEMESLHVPGTRLDEPIYRVTVALRQQTAGAFGERLPLRPGMLVDAEIGAETRRLYEWIFEPIYAMRGAAFFAAARP